jgi:hypothetical protein
MIMLCDDRTGTVYSPMRIPIPGTSDSIETLERNHSALDQLADVYLCVHLLSSKLVQYCLNNCELYS